MELLRFGCLTSATIFIFFLSLVLPIARRHNQSLIPASDTLNQHISESSGKVYSHGLKTMVALVFVDEVTLGFHSREKIEMYILTLMSLVDEAYHHPSLGTKVEVWLRKVHYLTNEQFRKIHFQKEVSRSLNDFCQLANQIKRKSYAKDRIDVFVLLTRTKFGPAGYAPVGSVCSPRQNCVMVQDRGLTSAYVIAHEIGHTLGMNHDGEKNNCRREAEDGKIMATKVLSNFYRYYWTRCSRNDLLQTLLLATCLDEMPDVETDAKKATSEYTYAYGITWSHHDQCRQEFGPGFWGCPHIPEEYMCERISCKNYNSYSRGCVTKHHPAIPKTICGPRHWCQDFNCHEMSRTVKSGGWSEWKDWTECSRTCGIGFQTRKRDCNNPKPLRNAQDCRGPPDEYRVCNIQECPMLTDFRAEQCREFNKIVQSDNLTHTWIPFQSKIKSMQCKLSCISKEHGTMLVKEVKDGTFCGYKNLQDRCFKGSCKEVGCDGVMHSSKTQDKCGVCGGNSVDCRKISDQIYIELAPNEYHNLVVLPKEARHIVIREQYSNSHASHFFALADISTNKWYLNGGQNFSEKQELAVNGAYFTYSNDIMGESLKSQGPLMSPLNLMVYSKSNNISSKFFYRYFLHKNILMSPKRKKHEWKFYRWSWCSKTCETGYQYKVFKCMKGKIEVNRGKCSYKLLPVEQRICNSQSCLLKHWWANKRIYSRCSVSCGVGVQLLRSRCMGVVGGRIRKVSHLLCDKKKKPRKIKKCFMIPCLRRKKVRSFKKRPVIETESDHFQEEHSNNYWENLKKKIKQHCIPNKTFSSNFLQTNYTQLHDNCLREKCYNISGCFYLNISKKAFGYLSFLDAFKSFFQILWSTFNEKICRNFHTNTLQNNYSSTSLTKNIIIFNTTNFKTTSCFNNSKTSTNMTDDFSKYSNYTNTLATTSNTSNTNKTKTFLTSITTSNSSIKNNYTTTNTTTISTIKANTTTTITTIITTTSTEQFTTNTTPTPTINTTLHPTYYFTPINSYFNPITTTTTITTDTITSYIKYTTSTTTYSNTTPINKSIVTNISFQTIPFTRIVTFTISAKINHSNPQNPISDFSLFSNNTSTNTTTSNTTITTITTNTSTTMTTSTMTTTTTNNNNTANQDNIFNFTDPYNIINLMKISSYNETKTRTTNLPNNFKSTSQRTDNFKSLTTSYASSEFENKTKSKLTTIIKKNNNNLTKRLLKFLKPDRNISQTPKLIATSTLTKKIKTEPKTSKRKNSSSKNSNNFFINHIRTSSNKNTKNTRLRNISKILIDILKNYTNNNKIHYKDILNNKTTIKHNAL